VTLGSGHALVDAPAGLKVISLSDGSITASVSSSEFPFGDGSQEDSGF
jgi:hypothetical protein